jgi:hypothetical protein
MHHRIIAFFISSSQTTEPSYKRAIDHLQKLAASFSKKVAVIKLEKYHLHLAYEGDLNELLQKDGEKVKFCVGPHTSRKNSGWDFSFENRKNIRDRFISISIDRRKISISNDYIGTIPVYYSLQKAVSISNIEPIVVLDSDSSYEDLSPEAVYELFRYTHLIWDETFYRHIKVQEPDSTFIYTNQAEEPIKKYHVTITPSKDRLNMKSSDIVAETNELNRTIVLESLSVEDDIILPLSSGYDSRMILSAAVQDKDIKSKMRCYTYTPNMSLESRLTGELCKMHNLSWEKVQLPVDSFNMRRFKQILGIFGSGLHVHGKYQLDFIDQIKQTFIPGQSVFVSGYMTGVPCGGVHLSLDTPFTNAVNQIGESKYITDEYLFAHSRTLSPNMIDNAESNFNKVFKRLEGHIKHKTIMFDTWTRQRNFISYQARAMEWEIPYIGPHVTPEYMNFCLSLPVHLLKNRKIVEMMFAKYYPAMNRVSSNSNLTVQHFIKRSISNPREGMLHYAPLLIKYFFKQPWLLPASYIAEMKNPSMPDLRNIGKAGVFPLFDLNAESREIFDGYFALNEVDNLFSKAMTGDELSSKRLTILETLAYALKMLEK